MKDFFGPNRVLLGWPDQEWAVLIAGPCEIRECVSAEDAMQFAVARNTDYALIDFRSGDGLDPSLHAIVLHRGYAWTPEAEHRAGRDCGAKHCERCAPGRNSNAVIAGLETFISDLKAGDALAVAMTAPDGELPVDAAEWAAYPTDPYRLERIAHLGAPGPGVIPDKVLDRQV